MDVISAAKQIVRLQDREEEVIRLLRYLHKQLGRIHKMSTKPEMNNLCENALKRIQNSKTFGPTITGSTQKKTGRSRKT